MSVFFVRLTNHTTKEVIEWPKIFCKTPAQAVSHAWNNVKDDIPDTDEIEIEIQSISRNTIN